MSVQLDSGLLNEQQAANYLGLSQNTLRKQRSDGERENYIPIVPYIKLGRAIRYDKGDLDAYIQNHRVGGSQE